MVIVHQLNLTLLDHALRLVQMTTIVLEKINVVPLLVVVQHVANVANQRVATWNVSKVSTVKLSMVVHNVFHAAPFATCCVRKVENVKLLMVVQNVFEFRSDCLKIDEKFDYIFFIFFSISFYLSTYS